MATTMGGVPTEDTIRDHETARCDAPIGATARRLQMCGLTAVEAATLTGRLAGLAPIRGGWTTRQVEHLVFLRAIVESGRLEA
jgi:hypothetical protein